VRKFVTILSTALAKMLVTESTQKLQEIPVLHQAAKSSSWC